MTTAQKHGTTGNFCFVILVNIFRVYDRVWDEIFPVLNFQSLQKYYLRRKTGNSSKFFLKSLTIAIFIKAIPVYAR